MFAASGPRVLRSGSKTRSEASGAGGPSVTRSNRGRGSRRGASPAIAADAPPDDNDQVDPQNPRAYGMQGKPAEAQIQAARLAQLQAVNPIQEAVTGAEGFNGVRNTLTGLDEEDENDVRGDGPLTPGSQLIVDSSTLLRFPGHQIEGEENHLNRHDNTIHFDSPPPGPGFPKWIHFIAFPIQYRKIIAFIAFAFAIFFGYRHGAVSYTVNRVSQAAGSIPFPHLITAKHYDALAERIDQIDQDSRFLRTDFYSKKFATKERINWFTPGFGASIDVKLSSPTTTFCDPTWKPFPFSIFRQSCPQLPISPPHKMVLQSWDDPVYDRWCSPNSGGKSQITVEIGRHITPTELVVEYMGKQSSPSEYMYSAPREIELWVRVEDEEIRNKTLKEIYRLTPKLFWDSSPQGRELHDTRKLSGEYVLIGRWQYDMYFGPATQGFMISPVKDSLTTSKFAIRINSNWGDVDFTCINRLRMYGADQKGIKAGYKPRKW